MKFKNGEVVLSKASKQPIVILYPHKKIIPWRMQKYEVRWYTPHDMEYHTGSSFEVELESLTTTQPTTEELLELDEPPIKASKNYCVDCGINIEPYGAQCSDCRRQA